MLLEKPWNVGDIYGHCKYGRKLEETRCPSELAVGGRVGHLKLYLMDIKLHLGYIYPTYI